MMDYTAVFVFVFVISLFLGFNAILALLADHLPEWIVPKGYYDDEL